MTLDIATRTTTAPLAIGSRVIFRRDPHERVTITRCERVGAGWSVSWRAEPVVPGVRAAEGRCPAEWLMPAEAMWMVGERL